MSDSDETLCGSDCEEANTQNSPSILTNWNLERTVFSTEEHEKYSGKILEKANFKDERYNGLRTCQQMFLKFYFRKGILKNIEYY